MRTLFGRDPAVAALCRALADAYGSSPEMFRATAEQIISALERDGYQVSRKGSNRTGGTDRAYYQM